MDEAKERLKYLKKKVETMEEELGKIKKQIETLEESQNHIEEDDGSWYVNHGHGD